MFAILLHGGSVRSTRSWSFTMLCMMSLLYNFANTSTALPNVVLSQEKHPKRMRVSHSSLGRWPTPCLKSRVELRSSSRRNKVQISTLEFSWWNHRSLGSSSSWAFSLTSGSIPLELPSPFPFPSRRGGVAAMVAIPTKGVLPHHPALWCQAFLHSLEITNYMHTLTMTNKTSVSTTFQIYLASRPRPN